ncbi:DUF2459 domain-containing protein [Qipengyuania spongiae]|uniref:DUF2459 domain-containing protein n=1 Tax=Qipengyuania spongiae TaxID=2909673 RepID=A0ABY5SXX4_9SPHN|nr:DUF2459 domain-containing protein [Qipengyuania spongiae]UVI38711.1 DUF2459 domain-containing protein [Qipengyuania spongiae]
MRARRWVLGALAVPVALVLISLLAGWIGSAIPRNAEWREPPADDPSAIEIIVTTNGIHTELVLPVVTDIKDWRTTFPVIGGQQCSEQSPTHVAIGYGEKEVFLDTPTWADLDLATALRIAFRGGDALLRVGYRSRPNPDERHRPLRLRPEEYRRLVAHIEAALPPLQRGEVRRTYRGGPTGQAFYEAASRYTLANSSNQWTADTLAAAGVTIGLWTPFSGGVMNWIATPETGS